MLSIAEAAPESEGPMQIHNSKIILIITVSYNFWRNGLALPMSILRAI
jgi:hypothetical protein